MNQVTAWYYIAYYNFIENGVADSEIHDGGLYVEGNEWWLFHSVEEAMHFEKSYAIVHGVFWFFTKIKIE